MSNIFRRQQIDEYSHRNDYELHAAASAKTVADTRKYKLKDRKSGKVLSVHNTSLDAVRAMQKARGTLDTHQIVKEASIDEALIGRGSDMAKYTHPDLENAKGKPVTLQTPPSNKPKANLPLKSGLKSFKKESVDQVDEVSHKTLSSYVSKAKDSRDASSKVIQDTSASGETFANSVNSWLKRGKGITAAQRKIAGKEERRAFESVDLSEATRGIKQIKAELDKHRQDYEARVKALNDEAAAIRAKRGGSKAKPKAEEPRHEMGRDRVRVHSGAPQYESVEQLSETPETKPRSIFSRRAAPAGTYAADKAAGKYKALNKKFGKPTPTPVKESEDLSEALTYKQKLHHISVYPKNSVDPSRRGHVPMVGHTKDLSDDGHYKQAVADAHKAGKEEFGDGHYDLVHVDHRGHTIRGGSVNKVRRMMKESTELTELSQDTLKSTVAAAKAKSAMARKFADASDRAEDKEWHSNKAKGFDRVGKKAQDRIKESEQVDEKVVPGSVVHTANRDVKSVTTVPDKKPMAKFSDKYKGKPWKTTPGHKDSK